ncbi:hypothetical protein [Thiocapsa sp. UBA6158]|jgi:hypothetical protein|uniref:hypothetical protein n=1 Tax=Thiocapsa sp. UBA6158 TaxID=1947692 RepID=UPI0025F56393|nr:hypothetical protein [Thiocapsa sp. UBA6158]
MTVAVLPPFVQADGVDRLQWRLVLPLLAPTRLIGAGGAPIDQDPGEKIRRTRDWGVR